MYMTVYILTFFLHRIEVVKLKNEDGPLGIRIVPADDSPER